MNPTTSNTGTLVLFAGSPTATPANGSTSNLGLKLAGATGAVKYKTYNADLSSLSTVVAGTRNFYYRLQPSLTVTGASVTASKVYDGTTLASNAVITGGTASAAVDGDSMGFTPLGATYSTADVGTNKSMSLSLRAISSSPSWSVSGYATTATGTTATGTITAAPLVVQANDDARFVTLSDVAGYAGVSYSGFVNQETSAVLGGTLAIARSSPGTNSAGQYTLTPSGLTATNYNITYRTGTYTIVPANQLLIRVADASMVYGSAPNYSVTSAKYLMPDGSVVDLTAQLSLSAGTYTLNDGASGNAQFALALNSPTTSTSNNPVVGLWNVTATGAVTTSPNFSNTLSVVGTQTITPRPLAVTATAAPKVYDGTTTVPTLSLSDDRVAGDLFTLSNADASFASKNAATGVTVNVTGVAASGTDVSNYQVPASTSTTANITPKALSLSGLSANAKTYDGTTTATLSSNGSLSGVLGVDDVQVDSSAAVSAFANKNVGVAKTVNVTGVVLGGADVGNYSLANPFTTTADITAKALTVSGTAVANKVYDGTPAATLSGGSLVGLVATDEPNVMLTQAGSFANKDAGNAKAVTAANTLSGSEAGNYSLTQPSGLSANITPKTLIVKANNDANFFAVPDSTTVFNGVAYSGFVAGESSANLTFANGSGPTVSSSLTALQRSTMGTYANVLTPAGVNTGNYSPSYQTGDFTVVPADKLLIRVPNTTATYGSASAVATPTASYYSSTYGSVVSNVTVTSNAGAFDLVDADYGGSVTVRLAPTTLPAQRSASGNANVGTYNLAATSVSNLVGANFSNTVEVLGVQTITPKALTISATASAKTYDGGYTAAVTLASTDAVSGDALLYDKTSALFANKNVGVGRAVAVQGLTLGGADAGNYTLTGGYTTPTSNYTVNPLALTASIASASSTYGAVVVPGAASFSNVVGADAVTPSAVSIVSPLYSTSNKLKAGTYAQSITATLGGADAVNYVLSNGFTTLTNNYTVNPLALTGSIATGSTTYGATLVPGAVTLTNVVGSDVVTPTASVTVAAGNTSTAGKLKAGSYSGIEYVSALSGNDAGNYSYGAVTGNYTVTPLALVANITSGSSVYGSALVLGTPSFSNVVGADVVTPSVVSIVSPAYSTSNNLVAGSYQVVGSNFSKTSNNFNGNKAKVLHPLPRTPPNCTASYANPRGGTN